MLKQNGTTGQPERLFEVGYSCSCGIKFTMRYHFRPGSPPALRVDNYRCVDCDLEMVRGDAKEIETPRIVKPLIVTPNDVGVKA